jgi:CheY-like chemotaxis protein
MIAQNLVRRGKGMKSHQKDILLISDQSAERTSLEPILSEEGYLVTAIDDLPNALRLSKDRNSPCYIERQSYSGLPDSMLEKDKRLP